MDKKITRKKDKRTKLYIVSAAIALGIAIFFLASQDFSSVRIDRDKIRIASVQQGDLAVKVLGNGRVAPRDIEFVTPKSSGDIIKLHFKEGQKVNKGDVILTLANDQLHADLAGKKLLLMEKEAELTSKKFDLQSQYMQYESESLAVHSDYKHVQELRSAHEKLIKGKNSPISELSYRQTVIRSQELKQLYDVSVNRLENFNKLIKAQLSQYESRVSAAREEVERHQSKIDNLDIMATVSGVIQDIDVELGQRIEKGSVIAKIINPTDVYVELQVPGSQAHKLNEGQAAEITVNQTTLAGHVERIDPNIKGTTINVDIAFEDVVQDVRIDMFVTGSILVESLSNTLFVTKTSSGVENGVSSVFRLSKKEDFADRISINTGVFSSNYMQILSGVKLGDKIILSESKEANNAEKIYLR